MKMKPHPTLKWKPEAPKLQDPKGPGISDDGG